MATYLPATVPGAAIFNRAAAEERDLTNEEHLEILDICHELDIANAEAMREA